MSRLRIAILLPVLAVLFLAAPPVTAQEGMEMGKGTVMDLATERVKVKD